MRTGPCSHNGSGGAHVERVPAVPACAHDVDDEVVLRAVDFYLHGMMMEDGGSGHENVRLFVYFCEV